MRVLVIAAFIALASGEACADAALADSRFDLHCSARQQGVAGGRPVEPTWSNNYRVDLESRQYCVGACDKAAQIISFDAGQIVFAASHNLEGPSSRQDYEETVSRITGEYRSRVFITLAGSIIADVHTQGTCTVAPFSGLPQ